MASVTDRNSQRRLLLRVLTKLMIVVSVVAAGWIILSPLFRNAVPVNANVVETRIDVSAFTTGTVDIIEWHNKPLIIARRSAQVEAALKTTDPALLSDAQSQQSVQPVSAGNLLRSPVEGWFVAIGIGMSSGCALNYSVKDGRGGFTDDCDASRYDLAGRALRSGRARKNLPVPHWRYEEGGITVSSQRVQ